MAETSRVKSVFLVVAQSIILVVKNVWDFFRTQINIVRYGHKIPGNTAYPLIGNIYEFKRTTEDLSRYILSLDEIYGTVYRVFLGPLLFTITGNYKDHEDFLSGHQYLTKGFVYEFLKPWLGGGLLVSTGEKWHRRRKILTPAFHFKILEQFVPTFNSCGDVFIRQLRKSAGGDPIEVWEKVKLLTLDIICETTMGIKMNAQTNRNSPYVTAVNDLSVAVYQYVLQPWLYPPFIFRLSPFGRKFKSLLSTLHETTNRVIRERREELQKLPEWNTADDVDQLGRRRRVAFLDLLLLAARDGSLSDSDIREEVDTFMFEGHDTTASAISFTMYLLSLHDNVQDKIYEELESVFDTSQPLAPTQQQLSELKYTEMVIKESMRIYPPVPAVSRAISSDYKLPSNGLIIPKGSELFTNFFLLHRNEKVFPDPETFDPERFSPDESAGRHPFAYLPFSAGPRNCIGQRFAMLELKSIIAKIIWNFHLRPDPNYTPVPVWEIILRTTNGIYVNIEERKRNTKNNNYS